MVPCGSAWFLLFLMIPRDWFWFPTHLSAKKMFGCGFLISKPITIAKGFRFPKLALQPPPSPRPGNWPELRAARLTGSLPTLALPGQRVTQSGWRLAGGAHANFLLIFLLKCFSPFVCPWSGNRDSVCGFRSLTRDLLLAVFCAPLSPSTKKPA